MERLKSSENQISALSEQTKTKPVTSEKKGTPHTKIFTNNWKNHYEDKNSDVHLEASPNTDESHDHLYFSTQSKTKNITSFIKILKTHLQAENISNNIYNFVFPPVTFNEY